MSRACALPGHRARLFGSVFRLLVLLLLAIPFAAESKVTLVDVDGSIVAQTATVPPSVSDNAWHDAHNTAGPISWTTQTKSIHHLPLLSSLGVCTDSDLAAACNGFSGSCRVFVQDSLKLFGLGKSLKQKFHNGTQLYVVVRPFLREAIALFDLWVCVCVCVALSWHLVVVILKEREGGVRDWGRSRVVGEEREGVCLCGEYVYTDFY